MSDVAQFVAKCQQAGILVSTDRKHAEYDQKKGSHPYSSFEPDIPIRYYPFPKKVQVEIVRKRA